MSNDHTTNFLNVQGVYIVHKQNRTRSRDMIIIGSITALYFITALNTLLNWLGISTLCTTDSGTRVEMFIESVSPNMPKGVAILGDITIYIGFALADGLLVSAEGLEMLSRMWAVLSKIFTANCTAHSGDSSMAYHFLLDAKPGFKTVQTNEIFNHLSAATFVAVAATSVLSTGAICLQIWRQTTLSSRSRKHYRIIINALIESSALYTVTVLLLAILDFNLTGNIGKSSYKVFLVINFIDAATQIISGLAPTLMIVRLVVSSSQEDTEVSSARLPSELISHASHANGANIMNVGSDLEMQQSRFMGLGEQESEEIQVVPRTEYHGQPEDELEDRVKTVV
ncbi:hypothetical protein D9613_012752 [Agrocybe pediades]|uniref:Uncharacterized protein n=1 Tax=Agrocybe pediades TaxID=84607 RepID=A0A8H4QK13_9AGAR|nr:hypothetical protein D9613_012752 [Agrocybe pediades]